jgi:hypothetical protein
MEYESMELGSRRRKEYGSGMEEIDVMGAASSSERTPR